MEAGLPRIVKLWEDLEVEARIWCQSLALTPGNSDWTPIFYDALSSVMNKILATKYHAKTIERVEREERHKGLKVFKNADAPLWESYQLVYETEAFFFQVKSCLDMGAVLLRKTVGFGGMPGTYGGSGDKVVLALKNYLRKKEGVNRVAVERLIRLIEEDKRSWIDTSVKIRDQLSHSKSMRGVVFTPVRDSQGRLLDVLAPKLAGRLFSTVAQEIYQNNLEFLQDFISNVVAIKMGPGLDLGPIDTAFAHHVVRHESQIQYLKFGWTMVGQIVPASGN